MYLEKNSEFLRMLEEEIRSIDQAFPVYMLAFAVVSIGYTFLSVWTVSTLRFTPSTTTLILFMEPYLLMFIAPLLLSMRRFRRRFFVLLTDCYLGKQKTADVVEDLTKYVSRVQKTWEQAIWFLLLYLVASGFLVIIYWRLVF